MTEKKDALATTNVTLAALDPACGASMEAIAAELGDDLESIGAALFTRVKMPAGGGRAYEIESDDPDAPELAQSIEGVVVYHHAVNAYWKDSMESTGGGTPPDCASSDAVTGYGVRGPEDDEFSALAGHACKDCPLNEFGSDPSGGKACKNQRHLYVLRAQDTLPLLVVLPPASLKGWNVYVAKSVLAKGRRTYGVMTRIGIEKAKSGGGVDYSRATFALAAVLDAETSAKTAEYGTGIAAFVSKQQPATVATAAATAPAEEPF